MSLSVSLGVLLTKALVSHLLGENIYSGMFADVSDLLLERMGHDRQARAMNRQVRVLAEQVGTNVGVMFKKEVTGLKKDTQEVVVRAVGDTLQPLSVELLVATRLEAEPLMKYLLEQTTVRRTLEQIQEDLYDRLLREVCQSLVRAAPAFPGLLFTALNTLLTQQHDLAASLLALREQPSADDKDFELDYRSEVIAKLDRLELFGVPDYDDPVKKQRLSLAYVGLQLERRPDSAQEFKTKIDDFFGDAQGERDGVQVGDNGKIVRNPTYTFTSPQDAAEVISANPRLIIRGEAGSGKSTLLRWIAVRLAAQDCAQEAPALEDCADLIPLFVPLRTLTAEKLPSPKECMHWLNSTLPDAMPTGWLHRQFKAGRGMILLDALDELPRAQRPAALDWIAEWVAMYPLSRFVITSRPTALDSDPTERQRENWPEWDAWMQTNSFAEATLPRLGSSEVRYLINRWYAALAAHESNRAEADEIRQQADLLHMLLSNRQPLAKLATNPLLCAMLCALYHKRGDNLPSQRLDLYQACIALLLSERDTGRKIKSDDYYPKLDQKQKLAVIQKLAYWMQTNEYSSITWQEADEQFSDFSRHVYLANPTTGQRIRELFVDRIALVHTPTKETVEFVHRSFQEYLVALEAVETKNISFLTTKASNDQWRETIILVAGLLRHIKDRNNLFQALIKKGDEAVRRKAHYHLLALACLETSGNLIGADDPLRQAIIDRAQALLPPTNQEAAKMLAAGGDPLVPLLAPRESYTYEQAAHCVTTLAEIGSSVALEMLAEYAKRYSSNDKAARIRNTLGQVWDRFDQQRYARTVLINITKLRLTELPAVTSEPLLPGLTHLDLSRTQISDLSLLHHVPNLTYLNLSDTKVSDLSFLRHVPNLTELNLSDTKVSDLSFLRHVPNLTELNISGIQVRDLSFLQHVANLKLLNLCDTQVKDFNELRHIRTLTQFLFSSTWLKDLSFLRHTPNLTHLYLSSMQLRDLNALHHVPNLVHLYFNDMRIRDLSFLHHVPHLTHLALWQTSVSDLSFLHHVPHLTQLDLSRTQISDLSLLHHVPNLTQLIVSKNHKLDLSPIQDRIDSGQLKIELSPF